MEQYKIVQDIMIVFAVVYFLLEVILNLNDVDQDTSNVILLQWAKGKAIFIPFAMGAIGGHLFLGTTNGWFKIPNSIFPVLILFGIAIVLLIIGSKMKFERTRLFLTTLLLLGVLYGHLFWSMNYKI
ncbi:MAG: hypothetical protein JSS79_01120 [Bacteroidetes bacterium]|nr:hypothetical protein [Bacteroidota bacterium]